MSAAPPIDQLTPREREILALIGEGYSLPEIAQRLHRSVKTVETHRLTLGRKLSASNRVELARIAIASGLVKLDAPYAGTHARPTAAGFSGDGAAALLRDFQAIDAMTGLATNAGYLRHLVCAITRVLGVAYAGVCQLLTIDGDLMSRILFMSHDGDFGDSYMYSLRGTPCEDVFRKGEQLCVRRVIDAYPEDEELAKLLMESYLGVRLDNNAGQPIGLLWLADTKPLANPDHARAVFGLLAQRVAGELNSSIDMLQELERIENRERIQEELGLPDLLISRSNTRLDSLLNVFRDFTNEMPLGVVAFDNELRIEFVNPVVGHMFGYEPSQLLGRRTPELFTEASLAQYAADHAHACETGEVLHLHLEGRRRDGTVFPVSVARSGLFDEHGEVTGTIALLVPQAPDA